MNLNIINKIIKNSKANPTEEICGVIYYTLNSVCLYPCQNTAENKSDSFEISNEEFLRAGLLGAPCGIYHSHPNGSAAFSPEDLEAAEEYCLPIYVYSLKEDQFQEYIPKSYEIELEGLPFIWGLFDCYSIVRNYLRQKFNFYMEDYNRDNNFSNIDNNIVLENLANKKHQNISLEKIEPGDVIIFKSHKIFPHHFGVFMGNSKILHHPQNRLSCVESLTEKNLKTIERIVRFHV